MAFNRSVAFFMTLASFGFSLLLAGQAQAKRGDRLEIIPSTPPPAIWLPPSINPGEVDRTMRGNLTGFLRQYYPQGEEISNFHVDGNDTSATISFSATKHVRIGFLWISKTANIVADVTQPELYDCGGLAGFKMNFDLSRSDNLVKSNAEALEIDLCLQQNNDGSYTMTSKTFMTEGASFGGRIGKATMSMLADQVYPILLALGKTLN